MKALLIVPMLLMFLATANAQTSSKMEAKAKKMELKEHACTDACQNGKHVYVCGEKGHKCSEDCAHKHGSKAALKDHVCTDACKEGKHAYVCGEKGHQCSEACMKKHKAAVEEMEEEEDEDDE